MATETKTQKIKALRAQVVSIRADKHEHHDSMTNAQEREFTDKIKAINSEIEALITEGAEPCEHCGELPHGMVQEVAIKNKPMAYFEVGCLGCRDHRAQGFSPEEAVASWNSEDYLPPKAN